MGHEWAVTLLDPTGYQKQLPYFMICSKSHQQLLCISELIISEYSFLSTKEKEEHIQLCLSILKVKAKQIKMQVYMYSSEWLFYTKSNFSTQL